MDFFLWGTIAILILGSYSICVYKSIIIGLKSIGNYYADKTILKKDRFRSIIYLIIIGALYYPLMIGAWMSTDAPSTSSAHIEIVIIFTFTPIVPIITTILVFLPKKIRGNKK